METSIQGLFPDDLCPNGFDCLNDPCKKAHPDWGFSYCVPFLNHQKHDSKRCENEHITWAQIRQEVEEAHDTNKSAFSQPNPPQDTFTPKLKDEHP